MDYAKTYAGLPVLLKSLRSVLMLLIVLSFTNCKTVKNAEKTARCEQKEQKNDIEQHTSLQTDTQTSFQSSDTGTTNTEVDEVVEETTWSEPDSTGTQHPVKTTKTHRHTGSTKQNNVQTSSDSETHTAAQSDVNDNSKIKTKTKEQTEIETETKTSTPAWVIALIAGIFAVILIVVLVVLRHYRII